MYGSRVNNSIKTITRNYTSDSFSIKLYNKLNAMKKIVKDSKMQEWNTILPVGYNLI